MSILPVNRDELAEFLFNAKRAATHDDDSSVTVQQSSTSGMRQVEYREGDLLYRDSSYGFTFFSGDSAVYYKGTLLWKMSYAGGVLDEFADSPALHRFLRDALLNVSADRPFRGPDAYERGACVYANATTGDVAGFYGVETVQLAGRRVYELRYHGGLIHEN